MRSFFAINLILTGLILSSLPTWGGGSRVGNGAGSSIVLGADESYQIQVPENFMKPQKLGHGVRLTGPPQSVVRPLNPLNPLSAGGLEIKNQTLEINDLPSEIPELGKMPKAELEKWFQEKGYRPLPSESRCVLAKSVKRNGLITAVVTWSNGKGYAASVESTEVGARSVEELARSTKILKGECEWK